MTIWYVHRRSDKSIASAHADRRPDYADEALDDETNTEIQAFRRLATDPVPDSVTKPQLIRALFAAGLYESIDAICSQIGGQTLALWRGAYIVTRADPDIDMVAAALGLDKKQVDGLFLAANKYP